MINKKQYIEEKYFDKKKMWSAEPIDNKWKQFAVEVLEEYEKDLYKELKMTAEFYSDSSSRTFLYDYIKKRAEDE